MCKLAPEGEVTFTRLFKILTKNRLELWRVELRVSKEGIVVVDQLGGVVVLVDLQLRVPVSVLTDRTELALPSRHEVFAECTCRTAQLISNPISAFFYLCSSG